MLHVLKLHANLLLVSKLASKGLKVHFNVMGCVVRAQSGEMLAMGSIEANLYQLEMKKVNGAEGSTLTHTIANGVLKMRKGDTHIQAQRERNEEGELLSLHSLYTP